MSLPYSSSKTLCQKRLRLCGLTTSILNTAEKCLVIQHLHALCSLKHAKAHRTSYEEATPTLERENCTFPKIRKQHSAKRINTFVERVKKSSTGSLRCELRYVPETAVFCNNYLHTVLFPMVMCSFFSPMIPSSPQGLCVPLHHQYVGEISPRKLRGFANSTSSFFWTLGKAIGQISGQRYNAIDYPHNSFLDPFPFASPSAFACLPFSPPSRCNEL